MFSIFELTILDVLAFLGLIGLLGFIMILIYHNLKKASNDIEKLEKRVQELASTRFLVEPNESSEE